MWNPFRRVKPNHGAFPKPKWPPIQGLDGIDIIGERRDGGVDLAIVASQPIDNSPETLDCIRQKVATYLQAIDSEEFQSDMGHLPRDKTVIVLACEHPIHPDAQLVIEECSAGAAAKGVRLDVRTAVE